MWRSPLSSRPTAGAIGRQPTLHERPIAGCEYATGEASVANVHGNNIRPILFTNVDRTSRLRTDGAQFKDMRDHYRTRESVDHQHEYVPGDVHSNTVENFCFNLQTGRDRRVSPHEQSPSGPFLPRARSSLFDPDITDSERASLILKGMQGVASAIRALVSRMPKCEASSNSNAACEASPASASTSPTARRTAPG